MYLFWRKDIIALSKKSILIIIMRYIFFFFLSKKTYVVGTDNPHCTDTRFNNKIHYNDNLNFTKPLFKR